MKRFALCVGALLLLSGCGLSDTPINQQQNSVSPSGSYAVRIPVERFDDGATYWVTTIKNTASDEIVYQDTEQEFVGNLQVYWMWDVEDRLWLYSTDTGRVYVWIQNNGVWEKIFWGYGTDKRKYKEPINPPHGLFPEVN